MVGGSNLVSPFLSFHKYANIELARFFLEIDTTFSSLGWFGIRKDFCEYLLGMIPCLQEYGNTSYKFPESFITEAISEELITDKRMSSIQKELPNHTVPVVRIDVPD